MNIKKLFMQTKLSNWTDIQVNASTGDCLLLLFRAKFFPWTEIMMLFWF